MTMTWFCFSDMVRPDKKSVLMYLTCLYEALQHDQPSNQNAEPSQATNQMQSHDLPPITAETHQVVSAGTQSSNQTHADITTQPSSSTSASNLPSAEIAQPKQNYSSAPESPQVPTKVARLNAQAPDQVQSTNILLSDSRQQSLSLIRMQQ